MWELHGTTICIIDVPSIDRLDHNTSIEFYRSIMEKFPFSESINVAGCFFPTSVSECKGFKLLATPEQ